MAYLQNIKSFEVREEKENALKKIFKEKNIKKNENNRDDYLFNWFILFGLRIYDLRKLNAGQIFA
jgi:hypothetical protein